MKRIIITIGILLIGIVVMAYLYFSNLNRENSVNDLSLNVVTTKAAIIFSFDNDKSFYEILKGQDLFEHLLGETKSAQLKSLKENLVAQPEISNLIDGQKVYIGIIPGKDNEVDFLISTQLKQAIDLSLILNKKNKITPIQNVYQLTFPDSSTVFVGVKDRLVLLSNVAEHLQKIIKEEKPKDLNFANYIKANSRFNKNTLANLYLNFNTMPALLKKILNTNLNGELAIFNQQDGYAAFSYNFSTEKLLFYGSTSLNNAGSYYKLFENLPDQKITINTILPEKTANYIIYTVSNYSEWHKGLTQLMASRKEEEKINKNIATIHQKYGLDLAQVFPKYFKNQFTVFQLSTGEKFGAIALSNGEKVAQLLLDLSTDYAPEIKVFKEPGIIYNYFGDPFKKFEKPFYTIIDNYLVIANNASSIQVFLNNYKNDALLISNAAYQNLNNQLSAATISFYVNNKNSNTIFGRNLKQPYYKQYQSKTGFNEFDAFSYQLSGDNGKFLSNLLLYKEPKKLVDTVAN